MCKKVCKKCPKKGPKNAPKIGAFYERKTTSVIQST
ncbi:hypothetical protein PhiCPG1p6 [Chlamydia phage CPG1]|nr:hypothetical protein PhiCPG1p6 [Chlamydia phage CPG1]